MFNFVLLLLSSINLFMLISVLLSFSLTSNMAREYFLYSVIKLIQCTCVYFEKILATAYFICAYL